MLTAEALYVSAAILIQPADAVRVETDTPVRRKPCTILVEVVSYRLQQPSLGDCFGTDMRNHCDAGAIRRINVAEITSIVWPAVRIQRMLLLT